MTRIPTDLEILETIYKLYYNEFVNYDEEKASRSSKNFVPLDLKRIGRELKIDEDIIFGRLYYDMERRFGYQTNDQATVHFFGMRVGRDHHVIHFPYMTSILAQLRTDQDRYRMATLIAAISAAVSLSALIVSIMSLMKVTA